MMQLHHVLLWMQMQHRVSADDNKKIEPAMIMENTT